MGNKSLEDGKKYYDLFVTGMTCSQIAKKFGVKKNTVAGRLYDYRKANGIPASTRTPKNFDDNDDGRHGGRGISKPKPRVVGVYAFDAEERKKRVALIEETCYVRDDGVIQCPPRHLEGYSKGLGI